MSAIMTCIHTTVRVTQLIKFQFGIEHTINFTMHNAKKHWISFLIFWKYIWIGKNFNAKVLSNYSSIMFSISIFSNWMHLWLIFWFDQRLSFRSSILLAHKNGSLHNHDWAFTPKLSRSIRNICTVVTLITLRCSLIYNDCPLIIVLTLWCLKNSSIDI